MIKKVPVKKLKVGVFVEDIGRSWVSTPFLFNHLKITSEGQIQKLVEYGIREVSINTEKGLDVDDAVEVEKEDRRSVEYIGISVERLLFSTILPFNLYIKKNNPHEPYLNKGLPFHPEVQEYFESNKIVTVYILSEEKELFEKYDKSFEKERELLKKGIPPGFESQEKIERYNNYLDNYMPLDTKVFSIGMKAPVNIYIEQDTVVTLALATESAIPENEIFYNGREAKVQSNLLIHINDVKIYRNFLREMASKKSTGNSEDALKIRVAVVKENSKLVTKDLLENPRSGEAIKEAKYVVTDMIENILETPSSFYGLMKINSHDYYTYVHSVNVCTLSIGLGILLGLKKTDIFSLATGALMHDVGKSRIPSTIINKPGRLTDQEFIQMKKHVLWGSELLQEHEDLSRKVFIPLLQHHEKLNGTGYPGRLSGDQIHPFGRISGIVDVYDALTTERSYKKAFKPIEAASLLAKSKEEYDQEIFKLFVKMLGKQNL